MVTPKLLLWALLLVLLGIVPAPSRLRTCSIPDVLRHYQAVIFKDLQAAEHSLLVSIASLGRTLRGAVAGSRRGALEKAAWTVALRTDGSDAAPLPVTLRQRSRSQWPQTRPDRRQGSRRRFLLRVLDAVATCWEKLFALRALSKDGP